MADSLITKSGVAEVTEVGGDTLGATDGEYDTGGVTIQTDLGRADNAIVTVDNEAYQAVLASKSDGQLTVQLYTATVDTTTSNATQAVDWSEVADNTDISGDTFAYAAVRE